MRETEKIGPPWEVQLVRDGGRLVELTIKSIGAAELGHDEIREATNAALAKLKRTRPYTTSVIFTQESTESLRKAYELADGRMTPEYLANLAVSYEEIAAKTRNVITILADIIGKPAATVKRHVSQAREKGYLTAATAGREGGQATSKAHDLVSKK
ncbi:hypothetical protein [Mycobacterium sp. URHB0021]|jgi:hypothetical protein